MRLKRLDTAESYRKCRRGRQEYRCRDSPGTALAMPPLTAADQVSSAVRILLADDHAAVRKVMHQWPQLHVVGEASDGFETIAQVHILSTDVVLMEVSMPGHN
jgi:hypothetical protein